jgi:cyclopropane fatty-acyl-phospholipid synthase-like methyltransferase
LKADVASNVPERIGLAVDLLAVEPGDRVLEIGCGSGVAAELVCDRLRRGTMLAIDRSEVQVERARRRNEEHVAAGRLLLQAADLSSFDVGEERFDKAFAVNVNLFWLGPARRELDRLRRALTPAGTLLLVYEPPRSRLAEIPGRAAGVLAAGGFAEPEVVLSTGTIVGLASRLA